MTFEEYLLSVGYTKTRNAPTFKDPVTGEEDFFCVYWNPEPPADLKPTVKMLNSVVNKEICL